MGNCSKKLNISSITGITVNKISNNFIGLKKISIIEHWLPAFIRSFLSSRISLPYSHHTEMFTAEYRIRQKKMVNTTNKTEGSGAIWLSSLRLFVWLSCLKLIFGFLFFTSYYFFIFFDLFLPSFIYFSFFCIFLPVCTPKRNFAIREKNTMPHFISLSY